MWNKSFSLNVVTFVLFILLQWSVRIRVSKFTLQNLYLVFVWLYHGCLKKETFWGPQLCYYYHTEQCRMEQLEVLEKRNGWVVTRGVKKTSLNLLLCVCMHAHICTRALVAEVVSPPVAFATQRICPKSGMHIGLAGHPAWVLLGGDRSSSLVLCSHQVRWPVCSPILCK